MTDVYTIPGLPSDMVADARRLKTSDDVIAGARDPSGSIAEINHEHRKVHRGEAYVSEFFVFLSGTTEQNFIFSVGNFQVHLKEIEAVPDNDEVAMAMFEDTVSTGGTQATFAIDGLSGLSMQPIPMNRGNIIQCGCEVLANPTIVTQGTQHIFLKFMPGSEGVGQNTACSASLDDWERVLLTNHRYHLWIRRLSGIGTTRVKVKLRYYIVRHGT